MLKISIIGNLGSDCRKNEGNFASFYSFSVAHSIKKTERDGSVSEKTQWINCVVNWDCSKIYPYLKRGAKVYCQGNASIKISENDKGEKFVGITCHVSDIELCGGAKPDTDKNVSTDSEDNRPF